MPYLIKFPELWKFRVDRTVLYHRSFVKDNRYKTFRKFRYYHKVQSHWDGRVWRVGGRGPGSIESLLQKKLNMCWALLQ